MRLHASFQWWGVYSPVVCSCYASVTRRFPTEELVALTVFNTGFSIVCDAWLRDCVVSAIFAKQLECYAELAGVGIVLSFTV